MLGSREVWGNRITIWRLQSARAAGSVATGILRARTPSPQPSPKGRGSERREKCRGNALTRAALWQFGITVSITLTRDAPPHAEREGYSPSLALRASVYWREQCANGCANTLWRFLRENFMLGAEHPGSRREAGGLRESPSPRQGESPRRGGQEQWRPGPLPKGRGLTSRLTGSWTKLVDKARTKRGQVGVTSGCVKT